MIEGYIGGRLGNQLLEYAMIRMLRWMRGDKEPIKLNFQPVYRGGRPEDGWEDSLRHFKVLPYKVSDCNLFLSDGALSQITGYCTDKLQRFLCHGRDIQTSRDYLERFGVYFNTNKIPQKECLARYKNVFFLGICENPTCFEPIKNILRDEIQPIEPLGEEAGTVLTEILSCNSVCVNVRLGDYLSNKFRDDYYICGINYYNRALKLMNNRFPDAHFFIFSDEISKANALFSDEFNITFVPKACTSWEQLKLMSSCKHFIVCNSTFSWWGQYLSTNEDKMVIAPDKWFAHEQMPSLMLDESFIKIPVGGR